MSLVSGGGWFWDEKSSGTLVFLRGGKFAEGMERCGMDEADFRLGLRQEGLERHPSQKIQRKARPKPGDSGAQGLPKRNAARQSFLDIR